MFFQLYEYIFTNRAYDVFLYSVLINMDPVNKLDCFDWMILINTEYVVYSRYVCVCVDIYVDYIYIYIYILVYKVPVFIPPIFIIDLPYNHNPDYYICCSHCLFLQPIQFFSNSLKIIFPFSLHFLLLLLYTTSVHIIICSSFIFIFLIVYTHVFNGFAEFAE